MLPSPVIFPSIEPLMSVIPAGISFFVSLPVMFCQFTIPATAITVNIEAAARKIIIADKLYFRSIST
jgi:hypothetical protein